jgi:hypothetical protein
LELPAVAGGQTSGFAVSLGAACLVIEVELVARAQLPNHAGVELSADIVDVWAEALAGVVDFSAVAVRHCAVHADVGLQHAATGQADVFVNGVRKIK